MREVKVGDRVVYAHKEGGFNALVTVVHGGENHLINLVYVDPRDGMVVEETSIPNIYHAHEEAEVPQSVGSKGSRKVEMVKRMVSVAHGHWRR